MRTLKFLAKIAFIAALVCAYKITVTGDFVFAQTTNTDVPNCTGREAQCKAELDQTEKEIADFTVLLKAKQGETASLARDAAILNTQIQKAKLVIKAHNLSIASLGKDIDQKQKTIETLDEKINRGKENLTQLIRKTNELDSYTVPEMMLSNQKLSGFFADLDAFDSIKRSIEDLFADIRKTQGETEAAKTVLAEKKNEEIDTRVAVEITKKKVETDEAEKQRLIKISKTQEKTYQQVVLEKQQKAAQIRTALFSLRDISAIQFGDALKYANEVSQVTGVRPAFLLAIIMQESDLGRNQGSCMVTDITTGNGVGKNTGTIFQQIMKAPRDTTPYQNITARLGRDYKVTPVSCPPSQTYYIGRGFGGGMGPSQFISSTWELFKNAIGKALGIGGDSADPWNPEHSFMATGIYMRDLGASSRTYTAERNAACKYYSGASCNPARRPANVFYGDQVMAKAQTIQTTMIDPLAGI